MVILLGGMKCCSCNQVGFHPLTGFTATTLAPVDLKDKDYDG